MKWQPVVRVTVCLLKRKANFIASQSRKKSKTVRLHAFWASELAKQERPNFAEKITCQEIQEQDTCTPFAGIIPTSCRLTISTPESTNAIAYGN